MGEEKGQSLQSAVDQAAKQIKLDHHQKTVTNINSRSIIDIGHDTIILRKDRGSSSTFSLGSEFLDMTPKAHTTKNKKPM